MLKQKPDDIAARLAETLAAQDFVAGAEAAKGFCNVRLEPAALLKTVVHESLEDAANFGRADDAGERWLIEYSGPNTNKPLHIGHLRNTILGAAMSRVVQAYGHEVLRYNIVNDRGIHICKSMVAYQRFGKGETPESSGTKGDQLVGSYYSRFAKEAAAEFEAWAAEHGQRELEELVTRDRDAIAESADRGLRKRFLERFVKDGGKLSFKPKKVKAQHFREKMAGEEGLEDRYQAWRDEHADEVHKAEHDEGVKRYQAASARRFEAEVSELHAAARDTLRRWEEEDPETRELWRTMNSWVLAGIEETYQRLGVGFDHVDYESETYLLGKDVVSSMLEAGIATRREDGAIVYDAGGDGPPKVLLRADGTSVYITQDLGSLLRRVERHDPARLVWVVGSEQELHFKLLFELVDRVQPGLGARCTHLSYGMVELPHGKMKSREGEIIEADGFLDDVEAAADAQLAERYPELDEGERRERAGTIGLSAAKYNLLRYSKNSTVKFDVDVAIDPQGRTGPYCLYALARTALDPAQAGGGRRGGGNDAAERGAPRGHRGAAAAPDRALLRGPRAGGAGPRALPRRRLRLPARQDLQRLLQREGRERRNALPRRPLRGRGAAQRSGLRGALCGFRPGVGPGTARNPVCPRCSRRTFWVFERVAVSFAFRSIGEAPARLPPALQRSLFRWALGAPPPVAGPPGFRYHVLRKVNRERRPANHLSPRDRSASPTGRPGCGPGETPAPARARFVFRGPFAPSEGSLGGRIPAPVTGPVGETARSDERTSA